MSCNDFSWRRFLVLLGGLSAESAFFKVLDHQRKEKARTIEGAGNIAHDIAMSIGRKRKG